MKSKPGRDMSAKHLAKFLSYDPETGVLTWARNSGKKKTGDAVGSFHSGGYIELRVDGYRMFAHQAAWLLMTGNWPESQVDHRNGDRCDNRWDNLRKAVQQQNSANMRRRSNNKSGYKGVVQVRANAWIAYLHLNRKTMYLGTFNCPKKAHGAYTQAAQSAWGDYARAG